MGVHFIYPCLGILDKQLHVLDWHSASYKLHFEQNYHLFTHGWPFDGEFEDPVEVIKAGQTFAKVNVCCLFPPARTSVSFNCRLGSSKTTNNNCNG